MASIDLAEPATAEALGDRLIDWIRAAGPCAVAFSGGVDSAVVAAAAWRALGDKAMAILAVSPSLASGERTGAERVAASIGIRLAVVETSEFENPLYVRNHSDRCFHCKTELYSRLATLRDEYGFGVIHNGAVVDDLGDHRPGLTAARELGVKMPLVECGITKADVRRLAALWSLEVWDKPATPCLSSRVAYGQSVTPERLRMIDAGEQLLRDLGLRDLRLRYHADDLARIEVPIADLPQLVDPAVRGRLVAGLKQIGFRFVTLDLEGFRSGSLNPSGLLPILP
jgi:uncharacterized protein